MKWLALILGIAILATVAVLFRGGQAIDVWQIWRRWRIDTVVFQGSFDEARALELALQEARIPVELHLADGGEATISVPGPRATEANAAIDPSSHRTEP
jgi:hypothetical protein